MWSDSEDQIIGGDLAVALAYLTPAGGAVLSAVAPIGLRDREAGSVSFTTSLGFGRKLERIDRNPRVALAYHAREHGFAHQPNFVLVQGDASYEAHPDPAILNDLVRPASERFMGTPKTGVFWDRWLKAYYADRLVVTVTVKRVISWADLRCAGEPTVTGSERPASDPPTQNPPKKGTAPRVPVARAGKRLRRLPHTLVAYPDAEGYPLIVPVSVGAEGPAGISLEGPLAAGARRAGVLGHSFQAKLIGLESRQYTGWLEDGLYAPHTESGFRAPANKTMLLLANGFMARRGLKQARAAGRA